MTPQQELPIAVSQLALKLAMNSIIELHRAKLLQPDTAQYCADAMLDVAKLIEEAMGYDDLPPRLAKELHALASVLRPTA